MAVAGAALSGKPTPAPSLNLDVLARASKVTGGKTASTSSVENEGGSVPLAAAVKSAAPAEVVAHVSAGITEAAASVPSSSAAQQEKLIQLG
jgi:hypothetical protein